jgi:hypothetical protein
MYFRVSSTVAGHGARLPIVSEDESKLFLINSTDVYYLNMKGGSEFL